MRAIQILVAGLVLAAGTSQGLAELSVPGVFSDHMVLQWGMAVPVWGTAEPGEEVTVAFQGREVSSKAGKDGSWRVELPKLKRSAVPGLLTITAGSEEVVIADVLVGEVWVGSGQSNMAGAVRSYAGKDETLAKLGAGAPYPKIRLLKSSGAGGRGASWSEATPEAVGNFSALLFAFGHRIHQETEAPVGLIVGAVGGTPSGSWLSKRAFEADADCRELVAEYAKTYDPAAAQKRHEVSLAKWENVKKRFEAEGKKAPRKPRPPVGPGKITRGGEVGNLYERFIRPVVGYGIQGVLWDQGEAGTALAGVDQYTLMGALISGWREEWGQGDFPFIYVQKPSGGGCAWDYENPVTREADPFVAELPSKMPGDGAYRELHIRIAEHPKTWMVSASDLGPMVHPLNKWGYGNRAAMVAMHAAYGRVGPVYGPTFAGFEIEGSRLRVHFQNVGKGLAFKGGDRLQGFAVAGADEVFHWAEARIDGDAVVVESKAVAEPVAVRYAWARVRPWANLFNKDGLPALTFRSDEW